MLGHKTREAASSILQPRAWVSNRPSFSFPGTNFSLLGCQSRTETVGRGTFANKSMSSPRSTSRLQPRNRPERRPTVRQARPLEKVPEGGGTRVCPLGQAPCPNPAPSNHVYMNENSQAGRPGTGVWNRQSCVRRGWKNQGKACGPRWEAMIDPGPREGSEDPQTVPAYIIS